jgi:hypothetical protein
MDISISKNKIWTFYKWSIFILMLESLKAWFFWGVSNQFVMPFIFILISAGVWLLTPNIFFFERKSVLILLFLYLLARVITVSGNFNIYIGLFITTAGVLFFAGLKDYYKRDLLIFFTHIFSVLIGISLFGWIIYLLGINMPYFEDTFGYSEVRFEEQYIFQNHYVFLKNVGNKSMDLSDLLIPRFSSVFLEPGYFSILLVILLYLNNFNLKKTQNIIFLIALFFTFSLAGWILGVFSFIASSFRNRRNKILTFLLISIGLISFYWFFSIYENGDNFVNQHIFSRLEYDKSTGTISGYNRTQENFDKWFEQDFINSQNILMGVDVRNIFGETGNVGWKVYLANYGLVGIFLYILFLYFAYYKNKNFLSLFLFILYILIFIRGHHIIFWSAFPILYLTGMISLKEDQQE